MKAHQRLAMMMAALSSLSDVRYKPERLHYDPLNNASPEEKKRLQAQERRKKIQGPKRSRW